MIFFLRTIFVMPFVIVTTFCGSTASLHAATEVVEDVADSAVETTQHSLNEVAKELDEIKERIEDELDEIKERFEDAAERIEHAAERIEHAAEKVPHSHSLRSSNTLPSLSFLSLSNSLPSNPCVPQRLGIDLDGDGEIGEIEHDDTAGGTEAPNAVDPAPSAPRPPNRLPPLLASASGGEP